MNLPDDGAPATTYPEEIDECRGFLMQLARAAVREAISLSSSDDAPSGPPDLEKLKCIEFASKATVRAMEAFGGGAMVEQHKVLADYRELMKQLRGRTSSRRAHGVEADA